jgi:hypothetical protein
MRATLRFKSRTLLTEGESVERLRGEEGSIGEEDFLKHVRLAHVEGRQSQCDAKDSGEIGPVREGKRQ